MARGISHGACPIQPMSHGTRLGASPLDLGQRQWNRSGKLFNQAVLAGVQTLEVCVVQADGLAGTHGRIQFDFIIFCWRAIFGIGHRSQGLLYPGASRNSRFGSLLGLREHLRQQFMSQLWIPEKGLEHLGKYSPILLLTNHDAFQCCCQIIFAV